MFRKLLIAVITAAAALLETVADAITATLPPPTIDSPRLRVAVPRRLCHQLPPVSPPACQRPPPPGQRRRTAAGTPPRAARGRTSWNGAQPVLREPGAY